MGHCEMLLAVAGLDEKQVQERTRLLAEGNWATFTPAERAAFRFARKQAREPWSITSADMTELIRYFGRERALDVIWSSCRCHSTPRGAEGVQLPLERENGCEGFFPKEKH